MSLAQRNMDFWALEAMKLLTFSKRAALGFSLNQKDILTSILFGLCPPTVAINQNNTDTVKLYLLNSSQFSEVSSTQTY